MSYNLYLLSIFILISTCCKGDCNKYSMCKEMSKLISTSNCLNNNNCDEIYNNNDNKDINNNNNNNSKDILDILDVIDCVNDIDLYLRYNCYPQGNINYIYYIISIIYYIYCILYLLFIILYLLYYYILYYILLF